jgi:U4/U6 small nuclear ribonucleoprotein PRP31
MSQKQQKRLAALKNSASAGGSVSGLSSSLAFTPVQGMELVDPALQKRRLEAANESWFKNETPGSFSVLPGQGKKSKLIQ